MSGFGRCAEWFAWQRHGDADKTDMMTLAKGLTGLVKKALSMGVSFAVRGNLIILAPPLVIEENERRDALVLLDRLLTEMEAT